MEAKIILLNTPTTLCRLRHGLQLTTVHQMIENEPFAWFLKEVANARRKTDRDILKQLRDTAKLKRNDFYPKMIKDMSLQKV